MAELGRFKLPQCSFSLGYMPYMALVAMLCMAVQVTNTQTLLNPDVHNNPLKFFIFIHVSNLAFYFLGALTGSIIAHVTATENLESQSNHGCVKGVGGPLQVI